MTYGPSNTSNMSNAASRTLATSQRCFALAPFNMWKVMLLRHVAGVDGPLGRQFYERATRPLQIFCCSK